MIEPGNSVVSVPSPQINAAGVTHDAEAEGAALMSEKMLDEDATVGVAMSEDDKAYDTAEELLDVDKTVDDGNGNAFLTYRLR